MRSHLRLGQAPSYALRINSATKNLCNGEAIKALAILHPLWSPGMTAKRS